MVLARCRSPHPADLSTGREGVVHQGRHTVAFDGRSNPVQGQLFERLIGCDIRKPTAHEQSVHIVVFVLDRQHDHGQSRRLFCDHHIGDVDLFSGR